MATLPQFAQRSLARRKTSDITRLATQFNRDINAVTSEYQTSFSDYQKKRDEIMAPYNAAVDQYKADYGLYETNLANYKKNLEAYTANLEDISKNPLAEVPKDQYKVSKLIRYGTSVYFDGKNYSVGDGSQASTLPEGYTYENNTLYKKRDAGTFTEKAPTVPTAPTAPQVEEFDNAPFAQKKAALETSYNREVGERKASKIGAVSRKQARPLLQGA